MKTAQLSPIKTSGLPEATFAFKKESLVSDITACTQLSRLTTVGDDVNSPDIAPDETNLDGMNQQIGGAAPATAEETLQIVDTRILDGWSAGSTGK